MKYLFICLINVLFLSGCDSFPKDPEGTLAKVKNGTLLVGYSENPPWVIKTDSIPVGLEPELVKAFAKTLNARIIWKNNSEQKLFEELEHRKLHLVIAGLTDKNPWKKKLGFTRPYGRKGKEKYVMAALTGENAFIVHLEKYLHERESQIKASL